MMSDTSVPFLNSATQAGYIGSSDESTMGILSACQECGLVSRIPTLQPGQTASCPRCDNPLTVNVKDNRNKVFAYGVSALTLLAVSCLFPFMAISVQGIKQQIALLDALSIFYYFNNIGLASILVLTIILLPALYLVGLILLYTLADKQRAQASSPGHKLWVKRLFRFVFGIAPWLLADIFFIGVLVSIIKMASMTDIYVGPAFWTYLVFTLMLVKSARTADTQWLCFYLFPPTDTSPVKAGETQLTGNHLVCPLCSQINPVVDGTLPHHCHRCHSRLREFNPARSDSLTAALLITALIFYFPANLYSMMYTTSFGSSEGSTIMDGVLLLWNLGSYPIALVILTASIILPMTKMLILIHLLWSQKTSPARTQAQALERLKLFRFIEIIGRWSMIDVFVVAILTALVQFGELMRVTPGAAVFYFALVVIFTLISTHLFDPRSLWQHVSGVSPSDEAIEVKREQHG